MIFFFQSWKCSNQKLDCGDIYIFLLDQDKKIKHCIFLNVILKKNLAYGGGGVEAGGVC